MDLQIAERKFDTYLKPNYWGALSESGQLQMQQDLFYGREQEMFRLQQSFDIVRINGQPSLTCVFGPGGCGKTSLINQIKKPLDNANGCLDLLNRR